MKKGRSLLLFCTGGSVYMILELIWRGWSHSSMFLAGGTCFLLLGKLNGFKTHPVCRALMGSAVITAVELGVGLVFNRDYHVWDYRRLPLSFQGQICLPFSLLWIPVGMAAMELYRILEKRLY